MDGARPPTRAISARARSAQARAPIPSKSACAASSDSRAARLCLARRCTAPWASNARPCSEGIGTPPLRSHRALEQLERPLELAELAPAAGRGSGPRRPAPSAGRAARRSASTSRAARTPAPARRARSGPRPDSGRRAPRRAPRSARGAGTPPAGRARGRPPRPGPTDSSASPSAASAKCSAGRPLVCSATARAPRGALARRPPSPASRVREGPQREQVGASVAWPACSASS